MSVEKIRKKIKEKIQSDTDWAYPYWIDAIKEECPDIPEETLDNIYSTEIKAKVDSMSQNELRKVLGEQNSLTSANQNFYIINLIEEMISSN